ncbi:MULTISPECIES: hypothetical protein [unclassified Nitratiruptor]|uniref:hypothetical protein n=1 Tax=unclassified Nitratiruptor TaxID=2624044 RepID=UPI0019165A9E|nr:MULTISPECIES: hypothetical protein [unclassified Nitratiruptor]BCD59885.1 hypothetical protein NitYY0810_C0644 [Nitratiruptor sp. YY08-10]BCD63808.1 hypothetical protein NitYY0814_C0643 [Nitratiruptor sp. YY08-14]
MKKLWLLFFGTLLLFAAPYTGFLKMKKGAWAKYEIVSDGTSMQMTIKYLGTIKYKGKRVNIIENEATSPQGRFVTQYWSDKENDSSLQKMITKTPQGIICMEEEMIGMSGEKPNYYTKTPKKYSPQKPNIKLSTYTLPSGKKISVAIFKDEKSEVWVSSQVPFGIVLVKENGKTTMKLIDFGLSGANPAIPLDEAKSCSPMALPFFPGQ